jgi:hypothetical protein
MNSRRRSCDGWRVRKTCTPAPDGWRRRRRWPACPTAGRQAASAVGTARTISDVSACQPQFMWLPARPTSTVSTGFSSNTPWCAQPSSAHRGPLPAWPVGRQHVEHPPQRCGLALPGGKGQPVGMARPRVGVLAEDHHLDRVGRHQTQRAERIGGCDLAIGRHRRTRCAPPPRWPLASTPAGSDRQVAGSVAKAAGRSSAVTRTRSASACPGRERA